MPTPATTVDVDGYEIRVSNPDKVLFPEIGVTKMDLVEYYLTVADAALVGCRDRPTIMHRFPNGVDGEPFYQKRVPTQRPPWVQTATITFPSGRHAVDDRAGRRRAPGVDGEPRVPRPEPVAGAW